MIRIAPLSPEDLPPEFQAKIDIAKKRMGFVSNDMMTMARWPELLASMEQLIGTIYGSSEIDLGLKRMMAIIVSGVSGCLYCEAHTAHGAAEMSSVDAEKVAAVWGYQTSELFTPDERAALNLAAAAGQQPNSATDEQFDELRQYYSDRQIVEIVALLALFGFLNRWNDTLATPLEDKPLKAAKNLFGSRDWNAGKHDQG